MRAEQEQTNAKQKQVNTKQNGKKWFKNQIEFNNSCVHACWVTQLCPTLCNPIDCCLPVSSVHGIFQARILEWGATSFSRGSSWPRDQIFISYIGSQILYFCATWEALEQLPSQKGYHKQMGFSFKEQNTNWEGKMFPVVHTWATHPTISSLSVPKCWFLAPTAKLWGTQCRSREFWREDPQDKWSWQLLGPYAKIPQAGLVGHK